MRSPDRRRWDRETLSSAALLAAAIVTLLLGAFEVRDQNALQAEQGSRATCTAHA